MSQVTNAGRSVLWIAAGTGHAAAVRFLLQLSAVSGVEVNGPPLFFGVIGSCQQSFQVPKRQVNVLTYISILGCVTPF